MPTTPAPRSSRRQQTYRWWLIPRPDRFPRRWSHWLSLTLTVVLAAGATSVGLWAGPWLFARINCRSELLPTSSVWSQDGECVGLSDGPYAFGLSAFDPVFQKIASQNKQAGQNPCATGAAPVTVGVLVTSSSLAAGGRASHELEGFAAGQANANKLPCVRPVQLRIAQIGRTEQAAGDVAQLVADSPNVVAVIGMGPSNPRVVEAVQLLANRHIPMVADIITAEGFDQNGSSDDHPDFSRCADHSSYDSGIGQGFFYRVAYRNVTQDRQLYQYLIQAAQHRANTDSGAATPTMPADFIITPTTVTDPFTCTALPLLHRQFGESVHEVRFDPDDPTTVNLAVQQLCDKQQDVTAVYAARAQDLSRFLTSLDQQYQNGLCKSRSITVASISDASRIRAPEPEANLESLRVQALTSKTFTDSTVRLVYTPLANPEVLAKKKLSGYANLQQQFTNLGFNPTDLDDGWAINAYDALTTITAAVNTVPLNSNGNYRTITPSQVNTAIGFFSPSGHPVPSAAQGPLTFDNNGNRSDSDPVVVQVCPATGQPPHSATVEVYPSQNNCP